MKKYRSKEYEDDCRIAGYFNNSPLAIARAVTSQVSKYEKTHKHQKSYEFYVFLKGKATIQINNEEIKCSKGDVILIEPEEEHKILNFEEETDYLTIKTETDPNDKIIVEE
jgi:mannose-6-phosphate isomerase-like protein (cupin superfamily)